MKISPILQEEYCTITHKNDYLATVIAYKITSFLPKAFSINSIAREYFVKPIIKLDLKIDNLKLYEKSFLKFVGAKSFDKYVTENAQIRYSYQDKVAELKDSYQARLDSGVKIDKDFAFEMFKARNVIKEMERTKMSKEDLSRVEARNADKYGNKLSSDFDSLVKKGKSFEQIAESATRVGGEDLGLKSDMFKCFFAAYDEALSYNDQSFDIVANNNAVTLAGEAAQAG
jgi:hypothetical protein